MSKIIRYSEDINDLVEQDMDQENFYKGGPGSGRKGHTTNQESPRSRRAKLVKESMHHQKMAMDYMGSGFPEKRQEHLAAYERVKAELDQHDAKHGLGKSEDINDLVEDLEKGRGPDKAPRKKRGGSDTDYLNNLAGAHQQAAQTNAEAAKAAMTHHKAKSAEYDKAGNKEKADYHFDKYMAAHREHKGLTGNAGPANIMQGVKKSTRPYTEDINDLVEKGGPGSGKKGHTTAEKPVDTASRRTALISARKEAIGWFKEKGTTQSFKDRTWKRIVAIEAELAKLDSVEKS